MPILATPHIASMPLQELLNSAPAIKHMVTIRRYIDIVVATSRVSHVSYPPTFCTPIIKVACTKRGLTILLPRSEGKLAEITLDADEEGDERLKALWLISG